MQGLHKNDIMINDVDYGYKLDFLMRANRLATIIKNKPEWVVHMRENSGTKVYNVQLKAAGFNPTWTWFVRDLELFEAITRKKVGKYMMYVWEEDNFQDVLYHIKEGSYHLNRGEGKHLKTRRKQVKNKK